MLLSEQGGSIGNVTDVMNGHGEMVLKRQSCRMNCVQPNPRSSIAWFFGGRGGDVLCTFRVSEEFHKAAHGQSPHTWMVLRATRVVVIELSFVCFVFW